MKLEYFFREPQKNSLNWQLQKFPELTTPGCSWKIIHDHAFFNRLFVTTFPSTENHSWHHPRIIDENSCSVTSRVYQQRITCYGKYMYRSPTRDKTHSKMLLLLPCAHTCTVLRISCTQSCILNKKAQRGIGDIWDLFAFFNNFMFSTTLGIKKHFLLKKLARCLTRLRKTMHYSRTQLAKIS